MCAGVGRLGGGRAESGWGVCGVVGAASETGVCLVGVRCVLAGRGGQSCGVGAGFVRWGGSRGEVGEAGRRGRGRWGGGGGEAGRGGGCRGRGRHLERPSKPWLQGPSLLAVYQLYHILSQLAIPP